MNIAFIDVTTTVFFGGIQTAVWELAKALADLGHQVTIYGGAGSVRPDLGGRQISVRTYPFTPRERFPNLGTRFRKLAERLSFARQAREDVVTARHDWIILTKPLDFFWPRLMPKGHPSRFAFMSGGTDFMRGDRWLSGRIDALVACSHFNGQQIYSRFKRPVSVIFNGVDAERFQPAAGGDDRRRALGLLPTDVVFVFAGRVIGLKGLETAILALAQPELADLPVKLLMVGDGSALPRLKAVVAAKGLGNRVVFHPAVKHDDLPELYGCADAGIFPALGEEAFGIAVAEAMACGLPVVASSNGGMPEVVGNEGTCGLLFELGSITGCAQAMGHLIADPQRRNAMGLAARQRILDLFTWKLSARRLLSALERAPVPTRESASG